MIAGVNALADLVKVTLGANGRNVVISNKFGAPRITKDGVTVADAVNLKDPIEKIGADLIKEVANKTVDISGDGTTTATVLAQVIIREGIKAVETGANPMDIKRGIEKAVLQVVQHLQKISKPISNNNLLKHIASISANNDTEIGTLIADTIKRIGNDGLIKVEESKTYETTVSIVKGMKVNRGYLSPYFVTNPDTQEAIIQNPFILLYEKKISVMKDILPVLEKVAQVGRPLLIIAEDLEGEALTTLVVNQLRKNINVCAVKSPSFGENRKHEMEDIATLTGGTFVTEDKGFKLDQVDLSMLGSAEEVIVGEKSFMITGGAGKKDDIKKRCDHVKVLLSQNDQQFETEKLKQRLASLKNGVAVMSIGGVTETEIKEKKDRIDDALCATRSAIEEGFVAGGGVAYLTAIKHISLTSKNEDEVIGAKIIKIALEAPFKQILNNGGVEPNAYIPQIQNGKYGTGYNMKTKKIENLLEAGVIDPTKVVRVALENAASIAAIFLTTEGIICEDPEDFQHLQNQKS